MVRRAEALATLEAGHRALAELFDRLDTAAFERPRTIGTWREWSAKDLAAHLGVWEELALQTLDHVRRGERPLVEDRFGEGAEDGFNDEQVERLRGLAPAEVRSRFEDLHARVISALGAMREDEWGAPYAWDPLDEDHTVGERLGSLLGAEDGRFRHAFAHLDDLRAYVETT